MGKSIPSAADLRTLATRLSTAAAAKSARNRHHPNLHLSFPPNRLMEGAATDTRLPLSEVVSDCVRRWFQDTLKEARAGDSSMQVLVGQMYYSGYGVPKDAHKGKVWMTRASRTRSSVWKVSDKHPGYNASDSDSDEVEGDSKQ